MKESCYQKIKLHILSAEKGTVFATTDFKFFGSSNAVRQALSRLAKDGTCRRVVPGIYYRPFFSSLLKKEMPPVSYDVAHALARNYSWKIVPSPIHAQNDLGISTQVPAQVIYTSTGPSRKYIVGNIPVEFRQSRSKFMTNMSYKPALVTNALQDLKPFGISKDTIYTISKKLSSDEKDSLQRELHFAPTWLQPHLQKIVSM